MQENKIRKKCEDDSHKVKRIVIIDWKLNEGENKKTSEIVARQNPKYRLDQGVPIRRSQGV